MNERRGAFFGCTFPEENAQIQLQPEIMGCAIASLPQPLAGLLASLPAEGDSWTKGERAKFITTFTAVLDFCFPVEEGGKPKTETAA
jgi:hypothetical protein